MVNISLHAILFLCFDVTIYFALEMILIHH